MVTRLSRVVTYGFPSNHYRWFETSRVSFSVLQTVLTPYEEPLLQLGRPYSKRGAVTPIEPALLQMEQTRAIDEPPTMWRCTTPAGKKHISSISPEPFISDASLGQRMVK